MHSNTPPCKSFTSSWPLRQSKLMSQPEVSTNPHHGFLLNIIKELALQTLPPHKLTLPYGTPTQKKFLVQDTPDPELSQEHHLYLATTVRPPTTSCLREELHRSLKHSIAALSELNFFAERRYLLRIKNLHNNSSVLLTLRPSHKVANANRIARSKHCRSAGPAAQQNPIRIVLERIPDPVSYDCGTTDHSCSRDELHQSPKHSPAAVSQSSISSQKRNLQGEFLMTMSWSLASEVWRGEKSFVEAMELWGHAKRQRKHARNKEREVRKKTGVTRDRGNPGWPAADARARPPGPGDTARDFCCSSN